MKTTLPCLHPKTVRLADGRSMVVPCGDCAVCRNSIRSSLLTKLNVECSKHKYVFFGTLTYADKFIPRICLRDYSVYSPDSASGVDWRHIEYPYYRAFMQTLDDSSVRSYLFDLFGDFAPSASLECEKCCYMLPVDVLRPVFERLEPQTTPYIPVLNYRDFQLFMKRLRKRVHNFCVTNKISSNHEVLDYFVVGEYGPLHFRPHYHFLLFCDSAEIAGQIVEFVSASWSFGYCDTSLAASGGQSAAYVAGYLGCYSYLPRFYTDYCRFWRPFCRGSVGIGRPDETELSEADLFEDGRFDPVSLAVGPAHVQCTAARSYFRSLFAPVRGFFDRGLEATYGLLTRISAVYRKYGYDGKKECFTPCRTLKIACSNYLGEVCESRWINGVRYYLLDSDSYPVDSLVGYLSYQSSDGSELVRDDLAVSRLYRLCLNFRNFLKLFGYDLYNFASVTFSAFCIFSFNIRKFVARLSIGSLGRYFANLESIEVECDSRGYSALEKLDALSSFVCVYFGAVLRPRSLVLDDGIYQFRCRRSSYFRAKLDELRDFFRSKTKKKELNDKLLFNSKYLNQYGRFIFA